MSSHEYYWSDTCTRSPVEVFDDYILFSRTTEHWDTRKAIPARSIVKIEWSMMPERNLQPTLYKVLIFLTNKDEETFYFLSETTANAFCEDVISTLFK